MVADTDPEFPKYTTQIMNTANQNSQGTRARMVGQMSEIIEEFKEEYPEGEYEEYKTSDSLKLHLDELETALQG